MNAAHRLPVGIQVRGDIEERPDRPQPFRARIRWTDPAANGRRSKSESFTDRDAAESWIQNMERLASIGVHPETATMPLALYGDSVMDMAMRGLEPKTLDPYLSGWRHRVVPTLGHLTVPTIRHGTVDRAVHGWIADGNGRSTIKNSLAALVRILDQAVRDGLIEHNPARITGWQVEFRKAEDELDNPRALALPDWEALTQLVLQP